MAALPAILISSIFAPLDAMPVWLSWIARFNPMTYAVSGARHLVVGGGDDDSIWLSMAVLIGFAVFATVFAMMAGRRLTVR